MMKKEQVDIDTLSLPDDLIKWIGNSPIYESSGQSGSRTVYIDHDGGAYLKIAERGALLHSSQMQMFFSKHKLSSPVLRYLPTDRDYMITAPVKGDNDISKKYLFEPERLSVIFGLSLRILHEVDPADCPIKDRMNTLTHGKYFLGCIYVALAYQSKGIGSMIMKFLDDEFPNAISWTLETPYLSYRNHHFL